MKQSIKLSIIICTYNRNSILEKCINSIIQQKELINCFEIIIVNNGTDKIAIDSFNKHQTKIDHRIISEKNIGLSFARNTGYKHAHGKWLLYLDDDIVLPSDYLKILASIIENTSYDCFGGPYYPIYLGNKPKWLPENFGEKIWPRPDAGQLTQTYLSGGNFCIKSSVLKLVGGFNPELGMKGDLPGYGEDDELQSKLMDRGYTIGFYPELRLKHWVLPHKYILSWHLIASFKQGMASYQLAKSKKIELFYLILKSFTAAIFKRGPVNFVKLVFVNEFYWQNFIIKTFSPLIFNLGKLTASLREIRIPK